MARIATYISLNRLPRLRKKRFANDLHQQPAVSTTSAREANDRSARWFIWFARIVMPAPLPNVQAPHLPYDLPYVELRFPTVGKACMRFRFFVSTNLNFNKHQTVDF
ncbi:hypothetical protein [Noviherbaspirillum sp.]|uniref:hypothetical protein n=1 Tax=Noviherbaspirillum sp. TaxID=1926288 RepID=UPI002FE08AA9